MTRDEFLDEITDFSDLISFCSDYNCYECEDIVSSDDVDEIIEESIVDYLRSSSWRDLRNDLNAIDRDGYYFYHNGDFDFTCVDDEFEDYRDRVLEWADNEGDIWEDAEETEFPDDEEEEEIDDGEDDAPSNEDFAKLFSIA